MIESFIAVVTRNSDNNFSLLAGLKVRHVYRENVYLDQSKINPDCQRILCKFCREYHKRQQRMLLLRLSACGTFQLKKQTNKQTKRQKKKNKQKLTICNLTNISVSLTKTSNTTKHALFAITVELVHESHPVFTIWLPFSPFANSQRSSTHPCPIPGPFF